MRRALLLLATLGWGLGPVDSTAGTPPPIVTASASTVTLTPGDTTSVELEITIAEGYHVQANPAANEFLIPLEVRIEPADGVASGDPAYPPPRLHRLAGADEDLLTYEGTILVEILVSVAPQVEPGVIEIQGEVEYQACDESRCFMPASIPWTSMLKVVVGD